MKAYLALCIFVSSAAAVAQAPTQLWNPHAQNIPSCPVVILSAKAGGTTQAFEARDLLLRNESASDVKLWAARFVFTAADNSKRSVYIIWPCPPGQFQSGEKLYGKDILTTVKNVQKASSQVAVPIVDVGIQLLYVELYDHEQWGDDPGGYVASAQGEWSLMQSLKKQLLALYQEKGETALVDALSAPAGQGEHPALVAVRKGLLRVYKNQGLQVLVTEISAPEQKLGPMIRVSSRQN
ncbi:MAG: hypothetical protein ACHP8A_18690 [Terriglobales bacterium]